MTQRPPDAVADDRQETDRVAEWVALVDACYPEADAASWDVTGLQVGDPNVPVHQVLLCLDVTLDTLAEAQARGADLVLAHHPLLFQPLARLTTATAPGRIALAAARAGIAVLAAHTNLDVAEGGTSDPVADLLGLVDVAPLVPSPPPKDKGQGEVDDQADDPAGEVSKGFGRVGDLPAPLTLRSLADRIAVGLPAPHLRVAGDLDAVVARVAVCGGAGDSLVEDARAAGADVYVTGDLRHHVALDARTVGLAVVDAGHHATEVAALPAMAERLRAAAADRGLRAALLASRSSSEPWAPYEVPPVGRHEEGPS